jgi:hypothetical protein
LYGPINQATSAADLKPASERFAARGISTSLIDERLGLGVSVALLLRYAVYQLFA